MFNIIIIRMIMEIYAAPELSNYTTALGAYNVTSITYEINQHTHASEHIHTHTYTRTTQTHMPHTHTHSHKHTHTHTHTHIHIRARSKKFVLRKIRLV